MIVLIKLVSELLLKPIIGAVICLLVVCQDNTQSHGNDNREDSVHMFSSVFDNNEINVYKKKQQIVTHEYARCS